MPKIPLKPAVLSAALAAAALLAACGSTRTQTVTVNQTQTVTRSESTSATSTSSHSSATSSTTSTTATASSAGTTTTPGSTAPPPTTTTRTETAPAFVGTTTTASGALGAAVALLLRKGYTPLDTSTYHAGDTLRVLIGRAAGGERAFFFDQGSYLGTDAATASGQITVLGHNDTEVTLDYATYRAGAAAPSGSRRVRFALDMGQLSPLDEIPSVALRR